MNAELGSGRVGHESNARVSLVPSVAVAEQAAGAGCRALLGAEPDARLGSCCIGARLHHLVESQQDVQFVPLVGRYDGRQLGPADRVIVVVLQSRQGFFGHEHRPRHISRRPRDEAKHAVVPAGSRAGRRGQHDLRIVGGEHAVAGDVDGGRVTRHRREPLPSERAPSTHALRPRHLHGAGERRKNALRAVPHAHHVVPARVQAQPQGELHRNGVGGSHVKTISRRGASLVGQPMAAPRPCIHVRPTPQVLLHDLHLPVPGVAVRGEGRPGDRHRHGRGRVGDADWHHHRNPVDLGRPGVHPPRDGDGAAVLCPLARVTAHAPPAVADFILLRCGGRRNLDAGPRYRLTGGARRRRPADRVDELLARGAQLCALIVASAMHHSSTPRPVPAKLHRGGHLHRRSAGHATHCPRHRRLAALPLPHDLHPLPRPRTSDREVHPPHGDGQRGAGRGCAGGRGDVDAEDAGADEAAGPPGVVAGFRAVPVAGATGGVGLPHHEAHGRLVGCHNSFPELVRPAAPCNVVHAELVASAGRGHRHPVHRGLHISASQEIPRSLLARRIQQLGKEVLLRGAARGGEGGLLHDPARSSRRGVGHGLGCVGRPTLQHGAQHGVPSGATHRPALQQHRSGCNVIHGGSPCIHSSGVLYLEDFDALHRSVPFDVPLNARARVCLIHHLRITIQALGPPGLVVREGGGHRGLVKQACGGELLRRVLVVEPVRPGVRAGAPRLVQRCCPRRLGADGCHALHGRRHARPIRIDLREHPDLLHPPPVIQPIQVLQPEVVIRILAGVQLGYERTHRPGTVLRPGGAEVGVLRPAPASLGHPRAFDALRGVGGAAAAVVGVALEGIGGSHEVAVDRGGANGVPPGLAGVPGDAASLCGDVHHLPGDGTPISVGHPRVLREPLTEHHQLLVLQPRHIDVELEQPVGHPGSPDGKPLDPDHVRLPRRPVRRLRRGQVEAPPEFAAGDELAVRVGRGGAGGGDHHLVHGAGPDVGEADAGGGGVVALEVLGVAPALGLDEDFGALGGDQALGGEPGVGQQDLPVGAVRR
mmetsp:Transcript_27076/g.70121  ORF Transcript_27076/g.70121 Transcript_27076/m.70121 type:complete len:1047 (-) Transcript_27076:601-3741(-)